MKSSFLSVVMGCTLLLLVYNFGMYMGNADRDHASIQATADQVAAILQDNVLRGQRAMDSYRGAAEETLATSLQSLFEELDTNGDGVIQKSEFAGMTLSAWAAFRAAGTFLPDPMGSASYFQALKDYPLPSLSFEQVMVIYDRTPLPVLAYNYIAVMVLIQIALFVMTNMYFALWRPATNFNLKSAKECPPKYVSVREALTYDSPLTFYEKCKIVLFVGSGLFFVKVVSGVLFFVLGVVCFSTASSGGRNRRTNPYWFRFWVTTGKLFSYLMLASAGFYHLRKRGNVEGRLLIANHICMVELVFLFLEADLPSFVSRVENLSVPLFSGLCKATDAILVNRDSVASRTKTLHEISARARNPDAPPLMIFPEGTCNTQRALFQFKRGAFEAGQAVQLVAFRLPYRHFNPAWSGKATGGNDMGMLLLRLFCQFVNHIEVQFLPVHTPTPEELADPVVYASNCQKQLGTTLGCGISDATFKDYVEAAREYKKRKADSAAVFGGPQLTPEVSPMPSSGDLPAMDPLTKKNA